MDETMHSSIYLYKILVCVIRYDIIINVQMSHTNFESLKRISITLNQLQKVTHFPFFLDYVKVLFESSLGL